MCGLWMKCFDRIKNGQTEHSDINFVVVAVPVSFHHSSAFFENTLASKSIANGIHQVGLFASAAFNERTL